MESQLDEAHRKVRDLKYFSDVSPQWRGENIEITVATTGTSHLTASTLLQSKQREESDLASGHWNNYLNTFQYLAPCTLHYNKHHVSLNFTHKQNANERMIF